MRHVCMVPGCLEPGKHALTLRVRRPDTSAVIAPNTGAYLCDRHAESGFEMDIVLRPNETRRAEIYAWAEVEGVAGHVERSIAIFKQRADGAPEGQQRDNGKPIREVVRPA